MKKYILLSLYALAFCVTTKAQTISAEQVSQDSTVNVIAYFCKNDTLEHSMVNSKHFLLFN